jgi:hypothetical protein
VARRGLLPELLVQHHDDNERERVAAEQLVGGGVLGEAKLRYTRSASHGLSPALLTRTGGQRADLPADEFTRDRGEAPRQVRVPAGVLVGQIGERGHLLEPERP